MSSFSRRNPRFIELTVVAITCAFAGFAAGVCAVSQKQMVVTPIQDAKFTPIDPTQPQGAQLAVLWGDPATAPSSMLLKLKKRGGRLHSHTSDYHLVLLEGTMKHWAEGEAEAEAKPLGPGSYWFQPGGKVHGDACITDDCLMFVKWEGKRDAMAAGQGDD